MSNARLEDPISDAELAACITRTTADCGSPLCDESKKTRPMPSIFHLCVSKCRDVVPAACSRADEARRLG